MKKLLEILAKPFGEHLQTLIAILFLTTYTNLYYYIYNNHFKYSVYILMAGYVTSYIITFIISLIKYKSIRNIILLLLYIILGSIFIIDVFCIYNYNCKLNEQILAVLLQTNLEETTEFFNEYINTQLLVHIIVPIIIIIAFLITTKRYIHLSKKNIYIIIFMLSSLITVRNHAIYFNDGILAPIALTIKLQEEYAINTNIKKYYTNPKLEVSEKLPQNVVLILGESFNKNHSSLYGYDKNTNPKLKELYNNNTLYVFKNITSPATYTNKAFQCILNTYKPEYEDSIKWYKCTSLPEILHICGYYTYWVSSQKEKGFFDICPTSFAKLCNENYFTENNHNNKRQYNSSFDENVLCIIKQLKNKNKLNFYFIHLNGQHFEYSKRYPTNFKIFTAKDYTHKPENQRDILASYDNSTLYNDSIIYEIINNFKDQEAIVMYTSDHGQDLFQSSPEYSGHGITGNAVSEKAGKEIPLMIYTSPLYIQNYPEKVEAIKRNINTRFRTDDIIYTIMDIIGTKFENNNNVNKYSLLSKDK